MLKKSLLLTCLTICGAVYAENVTISITSKIAVNSNVEEDLLNAVKEYGKKLTKDLASVRGVTEVETTVDSDCGSMCKREIERCSDCGGDKTELTTQVETKCDCGKPVNRKCSNCGKCCSSCSSCCK